MQAHLRFLREHQTRRLQPLRVHVTDLVPMAPRVRFEVSDHDATTVWLDCDLIRQVSAHGWAHVELEPLVSEFRVCEDHETQREIVSRFRSLPALQDWLAQNTHILVTVGALGGGTVDLVTRRITRFRGPAPAER